MAQLRILIILIIIEFDYHEKYLFIREFTHLIPRPYLHDGRCWRGNRSEEWLVRSVSSKFNTSEK